MKTLYSLIVLGIIILTPFIVMAHAQQSTKIIPIDDNQYRKLSNVTYYISPNIVNLTEGEKFQFGNAVFNYAGTTLGTTSQCASNQVNSTYKDYAAYGMTHFIVEFGAKIYQIDSCWPPVWLGSLPVAQTSQQIHGGINTVGVGSSCIPVILWIDKERDAGLSIGIGKTTWVLPNGTVLHTVYCNDNGAIHFLIKKNSG